jgi:hypothetical protein
MYCLKTGCKPHSCSSCFLAITSSKQLTCRARLNHPMLNPIYSATPLLSVASIMLRLGIDRPQESTALDIALIAINFTLTQVRACALLCHEHVTNSKICSAAWLAGSCKSSACKRLPCRKTLHRLLFVQVAVFCVRCWRHHQEARPRDLAVRAAGSALVLDAALWGALHAIILTSLPVDKLVQVGL